MRVVLDTNVLVGALLSGGGAPRAVLRRALSGQVTPLIGAALFTEYEDVLARDALFVRSPLTAPERMQVFDALMAVCVWTPVYYLWRPNLPDPGDDHLVELAIAGGADWIVTANLRDLARGELRMDRPRIASAAAFLAATPDTETPP